MKAVFKQGFSLIELMVVIAIIAILAAVAVPSYHNYVMKAYILNIISTTAPFQLQVTDYIMSTGNGLNCHAMGYQNPNWLYRDLTNLDPSVWDVAVNDDCSITVNLKNFPSEAGYPGAFNVIYTPTLDSFGGITWACNFNPGFPALIPYAQAWSPSSCPPS